MELINRTNKTDIKTQQAYKTDRSNNTIKSSSRMKQLTLSIKYSAQFDKIKSIINKYLPILYADRDFRLWLGKLLLWEQCWLLVSLVRN